LTTAWRRLAAATFCSFVFVFLSNAPTNFNGFGLRRGVHHSRRRAFTSRAASVPFPARRARGHRAAAAASSRGR
jgi:hypothetical protein